MPVRFSSNVHQLTDVAEDNAKAPALSAVLPLKRVFLMATALVETMIAPPVAVALLTLNVHSSKMAYDSSSKVSPEVPVPEMNTAPPVWAELERKRTLRKTGSTPVTEMNAPPPETPLFPTNSTLLVSNNTDSPLKIASVFPLDPHVLFANMVDQIWSIS